MSIWVFLFNVIIWGGGFYITGQLFQFYSPSLLNSNYTQTPVFISPAKLFVFHFFFPSEHSISVGHMCMRIQPSTATRTSYQGHPPPWRKLTLPLQECGWGLFERSSGGKLEGRVKLNTKKLKQGKRSEFSSYHYCLVSVFPADS